MTSKPRTNQRQSYQDPEFSRSVGRAIKVLRTARGLERRELADRAGVSYPYLSEIENGTKPGSQGVLRAIAEALAVPLHEMMAAAEELGGGQQVTAYLAQPAALEHSASPVTARSRWFAGTKPMAAATGVRDADSGREQLMRELQEKLPSLTDEDLSRVIDLVRRLGR